MELKRDAEGRRGRLRRKGRRREGASEGDKVTGAQGPSRLPRLRSPGSSRALRGPRRAEPGARSPGGEARWQCAKVPAAEAVRWGPDAAATRPPEKRFRELELSKRVRRGSSVQSSRSCVLCPPFPVSSLPSHHTSGLHSPISTPSWFRTLRTARPASPSKKIETIDEGKNYIYT